jgi:predicted RNase H-like HicB family nuclease
MNNMNLEKAREILGNFLKRQRISFIITKYPSGEWVAECNEIPAVMTGGMSDDITKIDAMIREAVLTAANIDAQYSNDLLKFVGIESQGFLGSLFNLNTDKKADYVLT